MGYLNSLAIVHNLCHQDLILYNRKAANFSIISMTLWHLRKQYGQICTLSKTTYNNIPGQLRITKSKTHLHQSTFWASSGPLKAKKFPQQLLIFKPPTTLRQAQHILGLFVFWRQHIIHLSLIFHPIYTITPSLPPFGSCPEGSSSSLTFSPLWLHILSLVLGHTWLYFLESPNQMWILNFLRGLRLTTYPQRQPYILPLSASFWNPTGFFLKPRP